MGEKRKKKISGFFYNDQVHCCVEDMEDDWRYALF